MYPSSPGLLFHRDRLSRLFFAPTLDRCILPGGAEIASAGLSSYLLFSHQLANSQQALPSLRSQ